MKKKLVVLYLLGKKNVTSLVWDSVQKENIMTIITGKIGSGKTTELVRYASDTVLS